AEIEHHQIRLLAGHQGEAGGAAVRLQGFETAAFQGDAQQPADLRLVVDDRDPGAHGANSCPVAGRGSRTTRRAPPPAPPSSIWTLPPWAAIMPRQMAKPMPVPPWRRSPSFTT